MILLSPGTQATACGALGCVWMMVVVFITVFVLMWQTYVAEMQVSPQGMPFVQFLAKALALIPMKIDSSSLFMIPSSGQFYLWDES